MPREILSPDDLYGDEHICPECDTTFYGSVCPECELDLDEYYFVEPDPDDYDEYPPGYPMA